MTAIAGLVTVIALLLGLYGLTSWAIGVAIAAGVLWLLAIRWENF